MARNPLLRSVGLNLDGHLNDFSLFKSNLMTPANKLFRITIHVGRGSNTEMPEAMIGAFVPVFVAAIDHEKAAHSAVAHLAKRGFEFIDIADRNIHEMDATKWDGFVRDAWPEFISHFPSQLEVLSKLPLELLFLGPFAGYDWAAAGFMDTLLRCEMKSEVRYGNKTAVQPGVQA